MLSLLVLLPKMGSGCREGWIWGLRVQVGFPGLRRTPPLLGIISDVGLAQILLWETPGISCPPHTQLSSRWSWIPSGHLLYLGHPQCLHVCHLGAQLHPPALGFKSLSWFAMKAHSMTSSAILGVCLEELLFPLHATQAKGKWGTVSGPTRQKPTHQHFDSVVMRSLKREFSLSSKQKAEPSLL